MTPEKAYLVKAMARQANTLLDAAAIENDDDHRSRLIGNATRLIERVKIHTRED